MGGRWRWHLGGVDCDGGTVATGKWLHLVGTFDGKQATLFENGKQVASVACDPNRAPWAGPLLVGQYSGGVAEHYQVLGRLAAVRLHRRALKVEEVAAMYAAGGPTQE